MWIASAWVASSLLSWCLWCWMVHRDPPDSSQLVGSRVVLAECMLVPVIGPIKLFCVSLYYLKGAGLRLRP